MVADSYSNDELRGLVSRLLAQLESYEALADLQDMSAEGCKDSFSKMVTREAAQRYVDTPDATQQRQENP